MSKRRTSAEVLADKIAHRQTELQRAYDRARAAEVRLMHERDKVNDQLREVGGQISRCVKRAAELGLSYIL